MCEIHGLYCKILLPYLSLVKFIMNLNIRNTVSIFAMIVGLVFGNMTHVLAAGLSAISAATMQEVVKLPIIGGSEIMKKSKQQFSRHKQFFHQFYYPADYEGISKELIVLLHGSGGNEKSLVPLARKVWPDATLLGVRGRVVQDGGTRWYKRITPVKFDQDDVRLEADAFVQFLTKLSEQKNLDLSKAVFVGYSNGANLLAASMMMHPDMVKQAVLMRSMPVLDLLPKANLSKTRVLTITGDKDTLYSPFAPELSAALKTRGASLDARIIDAGHMLSDADASIIAQWASDAGVQRAEVSRNQIKSIPVNIEK